MKLKEILKSDWFFVVSLALLAYFISSLPMIIGYLSKSSDTYFSGWVFFASDLNTYFAKMQQAMHSDSWLLYNRYTTEPHQPIFIFAFYIVLGKITGFFHLDPTVSSQIARFIFGFTYSLVLWKFIKFFLIKTHQAKIAYFLALFSTGFGWFLEPLLQKHLIYFGDFWLPDATISTRIYLFPHISLAFSSLLISIILLLKSSQKFSLSYSLISGLLNLIIALSLPYILINFYLLFFVYLIYRLKQRKQTIDLLSSLLVSVFFPLTYLLYFVLSTQDNAGWSTISNQVLYSPNPLFIVTSYGIFFVLLVYILVKRIPTTNMKFANILFIWIIITLILFYSPLRFQRRLIDGLFIPLSIITAVGFERILFLRKKFLLENLIFILIIASIIVTMIGLIRKQIYFILEVKQPIIITKKESSESIKWLQENSQDSEIVLSSIYTGNKIPALSYKNRVYIGHGFETANLMNKKNLVNLFYTNSMSPGQAREFIINNGINFVYYGENEQKIGSFEPERYDYLELVHENGEEKIYRVNIK